MVGRKYLLVCGGEGCAERKCEELHLALRNEVEAQGSGNEVQIIKTG
jgi:hypothetical protein